MKYTLLLTSLGILFLSACTSNSSREVSSLHNTALKELIQQQQLVEKTASLLLQTDKNNIRAGEQFSVRILIQNPEQKQIDSVRSWLTFDPTKLQVVSIEDNNSHFDISTPQERNFDNTTGIVSLGKSSTVIQHADLLQVATVIFRASPVSAETRTAIDFFNYSPDTTGHTGIFHLHEGVPYNIMKDTKQSTVTLTILSHKIKR